VNRRPAIALATGVAVAGLYLSVALWAGRSGPLARRPLLDGFAPPPPYHWVSPPPSLASANQPPSSVSMAVDLDPQTGSQATVITTDDTQAGIALDEGSIPAATGQSSATITITPLATGGLPSAPTRWELAGNVYRIQATYGQSKDPIVRLAKAAQVVLAYPAEPGTVLRRHALLAATGGRSWSVTTATDSRGQHLIQGSVTELGYFAVGRSRTGTPKGGAGIGAILIYGLIGLAIIAIALYILRVELRLRRERLRLLHGSQAPKGRRKGRSGRGRRPRRDPPDW